MGGKVVCKALTLFSGSQLSDSGLLTPAVHQDHSSHKQSCQEQYSLLQRYTGTSAGDCWLGFGHPHFPLVTSLASLLHCQDILLFLVGASPISAFLIDPGQYHVHSRIFQKHVASSLLIFRCFSMQFFSHTPPPPLAILVTFLGGVCPAPKAGKWWLQKRQHFQSQSTLHTSLQKERGP